MKNGRAKMVALKAMCFIPFVFIVEFPSNFFFSLCALHFLLHLLRGLLFFGRYLNVVWRCTLSLLVPFYETKVTEMIEAKQFH